MDKRRNLPVALRFGALVVIVLFIGIAGHSAVAAPEETATNVESRLELLRPNFPKRWKSVGSGNVFTVEVGKVSLIIEREVGEEERQSGYVSEVHARLVAIGETYVGKSLGNTYQVSSDSSIQQCSSETEYSIKYLSENRIEGTYLARKLDNICAGEAEVDGSFTWLPATATDVSPNFLALELDELKKENDEPWLVAIRAGQKAYDEGNMTVAVREFSNGLEAAPEAQWRTRDYGRVIGLLGIAYGQIGKHEDAVRSLERAVGIISNVAPVETGLLAQALYSLGLAYEGAEKFDDALHALERANEIRSNIIDQDPLILSETKYELGWLLAKQKQPADAIRLISDAIKLKAEALKNPSDPSLFRWIVYQGIIYVQIKDYQNGAVTLRRAEAILLKESPPLNETKDYLVSSFYPSYIEALYLTDAPADASRAVAAAVAHAEALGDAGTQKLSELLMRISRIQVEAKQFDLAVANAKRGVHLLGSEGGDYSNPTLHLAILAFGNREIVQRLDEDERISIARISIGAAESIPSSKKDQLKFLDLVVDATTALLKIGSATHANEAIALVDRLLKVCVHASADPRCSQGGLMGLRGWLLTSLGRWEMADSAYQEAVRMQMQEGSWPSVAFDWAGPGSRRLGQEYINRWKPIWQEIFHFNDKFPDLASKAGFLPDTLAPLRRMVDAMMGFDAQESEGNRERIMGALKPMLRLIQQMDDDQVVPYLNSLDPSQRAQFIGMMFLAEAHTESEKKHVSGSPSEKQSIERVARKMFVPMQTEQMAKAGRALQLSATQLGGKDSGLRALVEESQRIRNSISEFTKIPSASSDNLTSEFNNRADLRRKSLSELLKREASITERIRQQFPSYFDLIVPRAVSLSVLQKALRKNEAMVTYNFGLIPVAMVITQNDTRLEVLSANTNDEITTWVKQFSDGFNLIMGPGGMAKLNEFDAQISSNLYDALLRPLEKHLQEVTHLIIVPSGSVVNLPFGALLTAPVSDSHFSLEKLGELPWFARQIALTIVPTVGSLVALRRDKLPEPKAELRPFFGIGNPILEGGSPGTRGARATRAMTQKSRATLAELRSMDALPETQSEITTIANILGAQEADLLFQGRATETNIKQLDLSQYKILAFATHALIAGELQEGAEPGLVLTPPSEPSELDDGLLSASEVARLRLNAEWVVLSACSTASPDGTAGAEGLSGLARAFFAAGARALLVTHWPVASQAAVKMTTTMFDAYSKGKSKAQALQHAVLAMLTDKDHPEYAHPAFWAPFFIVGEGGDLR